MAVKTFTSGEVLTASDTNTYLANSGLVYISSTTLPTASPSFTLSGFSSTYDSYRIVITNGTMASLGAVGGQMTGSTASYYGALTATNLGTNGYVSVSNNNGASWSYLGVGNTTFLNLAFDLHDPFLAKPTRIGPASYGSIADSGTYNGMHNVATSYSSITLSSSVNFTGGTATLYGYRKA